MYDSNFHLHCTIVCHHGSRKQQSLIFIIKFAEGKEKSEYLFSILLQS